MLSQLKENIKLTESTEKEIHSALQRILSSDLFSRSNVLSSFIKFIVEETLEGRTESLKEYTIAVGALGKTKDFNPQVDALVRIHAGRLRRLLKEYYEGPGQQDTIKIEVIKGAYVPLFRKQLTSVRNDKKINEVSAIQYSRSKLTLAVLPFRNLCIDKDYQFFVDGFGEELTQVFSNFQDIAVLAHHSMRKYLNNPEDVRVIGAQLGVHYLINGSVKRTSDSIRVNVGLLETLNGVQIWSHTYSNKLNIENLTEIQDKIIQNVCSILAGYYGFIVSDGSKVYHKKSMISLQSFDASLWNYYFHMNYSKDAYIKTRRAIEETLKHDPNYAMGLAMLSELYLDAHSLGFPTVENPIDKAYELAKKAIKIDPTCQHAYQQYGWANIYLKQKKEALEALEYCLALNPSSVSTLGAIGFGMACAGEYERAHELLSESLDLNPHCPWWFYFGFFLVAYHDKQYLKALEYANKIEASDVFIDPLSKAVSKAQLGMVEDSKADMVRFKAQYPDISDNLKLYLNTFLMDTSIIDNILQAAEKATAGNA